MVLESQGDLSYGHGPFIIVSLRIVKQMEIQTITEITLVANL